MVLVLWWPASDWEGKCLSFLHTRVDFKKLVLFFSFWYGVRKRDCADVRVYTCTFTKPHMHTYAHTHIHTRTQCTYAHVYIQANTHINSHIHTLKCTNTHTLTHTHTHANKHTRPNTFVHNTVYILSLYRNVRPKLSADQQLQLKECFELMVGRCDTSLWVDSMRSCFVLK
jgi:hypothetical protein